MNIYGDKKNVILEDAYRLESPDSNLSAIRIIIKEPNLNSITCANVADYLFEQIDNSITNFSNQNEGIINPECCVVLVDFQNVKTMGNAFLEKYIKYCLTTKLKIFTINMSLTSQQAYSSVLQSIMNVKEIDN